MTIDRHRDIRPDNGEEPRSADSMLEFRVVRLEKGHRRMRRLLKSELEPLKAGMAQLIAIHTHEKTRREVWWGRAEFLGRLLYRTLVCVGVVGFFGVNPELAKMFTGVLPKILGW